MIAAPAVPPPAAADDTPVPGSAGRGDAAHNALVLARALAAAVLTAVAGLFFWSVATLPLGWSATVVLTGSMQPGIQPGDVVLVQPRPADDLLLGRTALFVDPARPSRTLVHRIVERSPDGDYVSKGDANQSADTTAVPARNVVGLARLRVPFVGLPQVWLHEGHLGRVVAVVGALTLGLVLVLVRQDDAPADEGQEGSGDGELPVTARDDAEDAKGEVAMSAATSSVDPAAAPGGRSTVARVRTPPRADRRSRAQRRRSPAPSPRSRGGRR